MRLGPSLGMVYRMGAESLSQGGSGGSQTGRRRAYAAAERSETGKSNDLCSSVRGSGSEVLIIRELRLKVQVATSTSLYTAEGLERVKYQGEGDIVQGLQYHRFVSLCIVQGDRGTATDKEISRAPLDSARDDRR